MEKVKRPKNISKSERKYLTLERYQDKVNSELNNIYDFLDQIFPDYTVTTQIAESREGTIYRTVIEGSFSSHYFNLDMSELNIKRLIDIRGTFLQDNLDVPINFVNNALENGYNFVYYDKRDKNLKCRSGFSTNGTYIFILEYTKN